MSERRRVLVVSDEIAPAINRFEVRDLDPELIVSCGDLPFDYLEYLVSTLNVPLVFVPGNHDPDLTPDPVERFSPRPFTWGAHVDASAGGGPGGCENIDGKIVKVAGLRIAGFGGSIRYKEGPNQYTQRQMTRRALRLEASGRMRLIGNKKVDLLVTHAPPLGVGDHDDLPHQGVQALHRLVRVLEPTYLLHGHIHPFGFERPDRQIGSTTIMNVIPYKLLEVET